MTKKTKKIDARQTDIFALLKPAAPPTEGSMNVSMRLRQAISKAIKASGKDRIDVCAEIYKLTSIEVAKSSLDSWSAESRDISGDQIDYNGNRRWGMPAEVLAAFCHVTGSWEPLHIVAEACNFKALKGKDVVRARLGLLKEEITKKTHELKELERKLVDAE